MATIQYTSRRLRPVLTLVAIVALVLGTFAPQSNLATPAAAAPAGQRAGAEITAAEAFAAIPGWDEVRRLAPNGDRLWPAFPEAQVVGFAYPEDIVPGEQFFAGRNFVIPGDEDGWTLRFTVVVYADEASAIAGFDSLEAEDLDESAEVVTGPAVGDETLFHRISRDDEFESHVRYRVGSLVGRVATFSSVEQFESVETLARMAGPVVERLRAILAGRLAAPPLPAELTSHMPSRTATADIGPLLFSAAVPVEPWALIDNTGNPAAVRDRLSALGARYLGYHLYGVNADPGQQLDVTVFTFPNETNALTWVSEVLDEEITPDITVLDSGQTGELSSFKSFVDDDGELDGFNLQFAAGSYVVNVYCSGPYLGTSTACESATRQLGELWYTALSR